VIYSISSAVLNQPRGAHTYMECEKKTKQKKTINQ